MAVLLGRVSRVRVSRRKPFPHSLPVQIRGLESVFFGFHGGGDFHAENPAAFLFPFGKVIGGFFTWTPDGIPTLSNVTIRIPRGIAQLILPSWSGGVLLQVMSEVSPSPCPTK